MRFTRLITITFSLLLVLLLTEAYAEHPWTGGGNDNFASNPANWSGNILPQDGDSVTFDSTSKDCTWDYTITLSGLNINAGYTGKVSLGSLVTIVIAESIDPPLPPSGLSAITISSSEINLSWTDNSDNETGFKIERKTGSGGSYSQIATIGVDATSYHDTGLSGSTTNRVLSVVPEA